MSATALSSSSALADAAAATASAASADFGFGQGLAFGTLVIVLALRALCGRTSPPLGEHAPDVAALPDERPAPAAGSATDFSSPPTAF